MKREQQQTRDKFLPSIVKFLGRNWGTYAHIGKKKLHAIYVRRDACLYVLPFSERYRYSSGIVPELLSRNVYFQCGTHQRDLGHKRRTRENRRKNTTDSKRDFRNWNGRKLRIAAVRAFKWPLLWKISNVTLNVCKKKKKTFIQTLRIQPLKGSLNIRETVSKRNFFILLFYYINVREFVWSAIFSEKNV